MRKGKRNRGKKGGGEGKGRNHLFGSTPFNLTEGKKKIVRGNRDGRRKKGGGGGGGVIRRRRKKRVKTLN